MSQKHSPESSNLGLMGSNLGLNQAASLKGPRSDQHTLLMEVLEAVLLLMLWNWHRLSTRL
jgi:hypothetical protein